MWRSRAFLAEVAAAVSPAQLSRFKKIYHEPFFVLSARVSPSPDWVGVAAGDGQAVATAAGTVRFGVSGSARAVYTVALAPDGACACTCMDAAINCRRARCVCKHVCFVLYRVLRLQGTAFFMNANRLPEGLVADTAASVLDGRLNVHHDERESIPQGDVDALCEALGRLGRSLPPRASDSASSGVGGTSRRQAPAPAPAQHAQQAHAQAQAPDFLTVRRAPEPDDECPVCYDLLVGGGGGELRGCPDCGRGVHRACIDRWLWAAPRPTCVFCRSRVWGAYVGVAPPTTQTGGGGLG